MTYGRVPFKCDFRPWQDSDLTATLAWRRAAPDAPVLGFPSRIQALNLVSRPWVAAGVGEVYGSLGDPNWAAPPPFQKFDHVCGTREDFAEGGVYDPDAPPVEYDANGVPACCNPPVVARGGVAVGGVATVSYSGVVYDFEYTFLSLGLNINCFADIPNQRWVGADAFGSSAVITSPLFGGQGYWRVEIAGAGGFHCDYRSSTYTGHGSEFIHLYSGDGACFATGLLIGL